jgi:hypothetical protein
LNRCKAVKTVTKEIARGNISLLLPIESLIITSLEDDISPAVYTIHDTNAMPNMMTNESLTVPCFPKIIGIVLLPACLSPEISPISFSGEVTNTISAITVPENIGSRKPSIPILKIVSIYTLDPSSKEHIIASAMAKVFTKNLSLSEIFGIEYKIPIRTMRNVNNKLFRLPIKMGTAIPARFIAMTNITA